MSLNPWDSESYRIHTTDEKFPALWVINGGGGFLILDKRKEHELPKNNRSADGKQSSRQL